MNSESTNSWPRGFWSLMFTQFQGAFSDNALRWLVIFPVLAGRLSRGRIEYGLIPPGAALMALAGFLLGWPEISKTGFTIALSLLGLGGGLFIVPIISVLQYRPSPQTKGAVQGAASWLSWVGIAAAAISQTLLSGPAHLSCGQIFWVCGGVAGLAGVFVIWSRPQALPEMLARWSNSNP